MTRALVRTMGIQNRWTFGVSDCDFTDWATLMSAVASGDNVTILKGTYSPTTNYIISKPLTIEFQQGAIFDGTSAGTKGFSITASDVILKINGALMRNWITSGDYAIYVESGANRVTIVDGRFTNNFGDIYAQTSTLLDRNISY